MRLRSKLANLALAVGSAAATLLVCEGLTALWVRLHPSLGQTASRLLRSHPPPYARSPYYSLQFVEEQELRGGTFAMTPNNQRVLVRDAQGAHINNAGGHRVTTDTPEQPQARIVVFGGSTVYCGEVPDPFTLPSFLQRLVSLAAPGHYAVVNAGASSVNVAQQVSWLRATALAAGDIVVFYDGINDLSAGVYYQIPLATVAESEQIQYARLNPLQRLVVGLEGVPVVGRSYLLDYLLYPFAYRELPPHVKDARRRALLFEQTAQVYREKLREAHAISQARGARFVHFLQPHLFSFPLRTRFEQELAANPRVVQGGIREVLALGQPHLRGVGDELRREGIESVDLSQAFGGLPASEDVYLDSMHVTEVGNRLVAQAILHALFPERLPQASAASEQQISAYHEEDRATWNRFVSRRSESESRYRTGAATLLRNGDFAAGLASWTMPQPVELSEDGYPRVSMHNFLWQEIEPIADRMQVALTARCAVGSTVRASLHWADKTGFLDLGVDRFSFECEGVRARSVFAVRRPEAVARAILVIDVPDDEHAAVVYGVGAHPLVAQTDVAR